MSERPWALAGFSGSGKSTVGRLLASRAGRRFLDLDEVIGRTRVLELLAPGEDCLREAEASALEGLTEAAATQRDPPGLVLALGGGTLESVACRRFLEHRFLVAWLDVPLRVALERCRGDAHVERPVLSRHAASGPEALAALHEQRHRQAGWAQVRVDATPSPSDVARVLHRLLNDAEAAS